MNQDPQDALRQDPASGLGYPDFLAARERYRAALRAGAVVARLERLLRLPAYGEPPRGIAPARPAESTPEKGGPIVS
jgi:hypothetical protein